MLHQAALGSVPRSLQDPLLTNENNINGFLNMLVAARDADVKRFVYAASASCSRPSSVMYRKYRDVQLSREGGKSVVSIPAGAAHHFAIDSVHCA